MTITNIALRGVMIWFNTYLSDKLKSEGMGVFSLVMTIYSFAVTVATSGISLATTRLVSEEDALKHELGVKKAVYRCLFFAITLSFISFSAVYIFSGYISGVIFKDMLSVKFVKLLALCFPSISISAVLNGYFTAIRQVSKSSFTQVFEQAVKIFITIILFEYFKPTTIESCCTYIITGNIIGEFLSMLMGIAFYIYSVKKPNNNKYSNDINKRIIRIALPVALSSYIKSALSSIKQILIPSQLERTANSSKDALSTYGRINAMAMPVITFPSAICTSAAGLIIPEIASFYVRKEYKKIEKVINAMFKVTIIFSLPISALLFIYGKELGNFFYSCTETGIYISLLAPLTIIMYADTLTDSLLKGLDCQVSVVRINILDTFLCIALILILIPSMGSTGYILILYLSEIFNIILSLRKLIQKTKIKFSIYDLILKPTFCIALSVYISTFFKLQAFLNSAFIICVYLGLLFLSKSIKFKKTLLKIL